MQTGPNKLGPTNQISLVAGRLFDEEDFAGPAKQDDRNYKSARILFTYDTGPTKEMSLVAARLFSEEDFAGPAKQDDLRYKPARILFTYDTGPTK